MKNILSLFFLLYAPLISTMNRNNTAQGTTLHSAYSFINVNNKCMFPLSITFTSNIYTKEENPLFPITSHTTNIKRAKMEPSKTQMLQFSECFHYEKGNFVNTSFSILEIDVQHLLDSNYASQLKVYLDHDFKNPQLIISNNNDNGLTLKISTQGNN